MTIADFIFTTLKNRFPDLNWKVGSTLRELIAAPLVTVTESAMINLDSQINLTNINDLSELNAEQLTIIDDLFYRLSLQRNETVMATGTVTVLVNSINAPTILEGTMFTYNDVTVAVARTVEPSAVPSSSEFYTPLRQVGYETYAFEVSVACVTVNSTLSKGTALIWAEAPDTVDSLTITNPLSGGSSGLTYESKISMIRDYLSPNILNMNEGLTKLLRSSLSGTVADCMYAKDMNEPVKTYVYLKTLKAPGTFYTQSEAIKQGDYYSVRKTIPGVIDVAAIYVNGEKKTIINKKITHNDVYCEVALNSDNPVVAVDVELYGLSDALKVQEFIDGYTIGTPYNWEVIAPDTFDISLEFKYKGSTLYVSQLQEICERFQSMPLNVRLSDGYLSQILSEYGATLVGTCTYTITDIKGNCYKQITSPVVRNTKHESYAIYLGINNIKATHV